MKPMKNEEKQKRAENAKMFDFFKKQTKNNKTFQN